MLLTELNSVPPGSEIHPDMITLRTLPVGDVFKHINKYFIVLEQPKTHVSAFDIQNMCVTKLHNGAVVQKAVSAITVSPVFKYVAPQGE